MLESMGISVEYSHHEGAPGQQEIDLRYADALTTADNVMSFRLVMKEVAIEQGVYATFMPKPFTAIPAPACTRMCLCRGRQDAFYEAGSEFQLSKTGRAFIAGLLRHAPEITAVCNQWVNSYKRLWGADDGGRRRRGAGLCLLGTQKPLRPGAGADVQAEGEHRPGSSSLAGCRLQPVPGLRRDPWAGLKGIENDYELPPARKTTYGPLTLAERVGVRDAAGRTWPGDPA